MYEVITPAGIIICDLAEAIQYRKVYGYPYRKYKADKTIKDYTS